MSGEGWILCMTVWYYEGRLWYIKDGLVKSRHTTVKEERLLLGNFYPTMGTFFIKFCGLYSSRIGPFRILVTGKVLRSIVAENTPPTPRPIEL